MNRKTLASGILLLFLISMVSPIAFGFNVEESEDTTYLDDISYAYSAPDEMGGKDIDYSRNNQQYHSLNELTYYLEEQPSNPLGGPIDSDWPMASHDNHHTGLSPYNTAHVTGIEKWRFKTSFSVDTGIAIDTDGTLYFGSFDGTLFAVNPDGSLKWKDEAIGLITTSTPCISEDGVIYIAGHSALAAYSRNGTRLWKTGLGGNAASAPAIDNDGVIHVGHMDNDWVALYPNGTIKWKYTTGDRIVSSAAIADDGTIFFGSADDYVYALNPNGTLKWKYLTNGDVKGSPSIDDNGIIYIASWGDYLHAIYPNGTIKWKTKIGSGSETTPCFGPDGTIYVSYEKLWAINPTDGSVKWTYDYLEYNEVSFLSNPAISADGIIYIGTQIDGIYGGQIYAINHDGSLRWKKFLTTDYIVSSPAIGDDGTVYIGSSEDSNAESGVGYLHAFNEITSNEPPLAPEYLGNTNTSAFYDWYMFRAHDPDNNPYQYYIDWGDGYTTGWTREFANNELYEEDHMYFVIDDYTLRIKTRDVMGAESDWTIVPIKAHYTNNFPMFQRLLNTFPTLSYFISILRGIL